MIKEKRKQKKYTQEKMSQLLGISLRQYVRIDNEEDLRQCHDDDVGRKPVHIGRQRRYLDYAQRNRQGKPDKGRHMSRKAGRRGHKQTQTFQRASLP